MGGLAATARMVEANAHGVLYLDAAYLVDQAFGSE